MDKTQQSGLGVGLVSALAVVCCASLPLVVAAGLSVALLAWIGGIAVGAVAPTAAIVLLALRARRRRVAGCAAPSGEVKEVS